VEKDARGDARGRDARARTYLGEARVVVRRVRGEFQRPGSRKPLHHPLAIDSKRESALAREVREMPAAPLDRPGWSRERTTSGVALPAGPAHRGRATGGTISSTVTYRFRPRLQAAALLCHALDLLDRSGAEGLTAAELKRLLFAMGTSIESDCNADETVLSLSGWTATWRPACACSSAGCARARFDRKTVADLAENEISQRGDDMEDPRSSGRRSRVHHARRRLALSGRAFQPRAPRRAPGQLRALLAALPDCQAQGRHLLRPPLGRGGGAGGRPGFQARAAGPAARSGALPAQHADADPPGRSQAGPVAAHHRGGQAAGRADDRVVARLYSQYMGGNMGSVVNPGDPRGARAGLQRMASYAAGVRLEDESGVVAFAGTQPEKTSQALATMLGLLAAGDRRDPLRGGAARARRGVPGQPADPRAARAW